MSYKALDVLFRHLWLVLLPLVVLVGVGVVGTALRLQHNYSSTARAWSQDTPLFVTTLAPDNPYLTPAQNQAQIFNDLLKLDSFVLRVAGQVPGLQGLPPETQIAAIRTGTYISAEGVNVLSITHQSEDPALTNSVVDAILLTYTETYKADVVSQGDAAITFYETRLEAARTELAAREQALAEYQATGSTTLPLGDETDPSLVQLQAAERAARDDYNNLLDTLEEIRLDKEAALTGKDVGFRVMDPAMQPMSALPNSMKDLLALPLLGLLLGISASGTLLFALIRLDDRIRLPLEIKDMGLPVVAVPQLAQRRGSWPKHFVRLTVMVSRGLLGSGR